MNDLFDWQPPPCRGHAPSQAHSPTSQAAAETIEPILGRLQARVLGFLRINPEGATDEEMQDMLHMGANTQRPRRRELQLKGLVANSGRTRKLRSGEQGTVWVAR